MRGYAIKKKIDKPKKDIKRFLIGKIQNFRKYSLFYPFEKEYSEEFIVPKKLNLNALDNDIVKVEITKYPGRRITGECRVVKIIGNENNPEIDVKIVIERFNLPLLFPKEVLSEALNIPKNVSKKMFKGRTDLTCLLTFTIDGEKARDFDDAVSIRKENGSYTLYVSIADVAEYVTYASALDKEAYGRGTSVYFPEAAIPMLPESLSNNICSLNPNVDRLTITVEMKFNEKGEMLKSRIYESVIRSDARITYEDAGSKIRDNEAFENKNILPALKIMVELSSILRKKRAARGSIDFDLPEPEIVLDMTGRIVDIFKAERNEVHQLIEEFMISANETVAAFLTENEIPMIYRIHEVPSEDKIDSLKEAFLPLGIKLPENLTPLSIQKILKKGKGKPNERLVNTLILRSMKQARYSGKNLKHFGLSSECYTHFTSPIRRYPDLVIHSILKHFLRYSQPPAGRFMKSLDAIAEHSSERERVAMEAEREIIKMKQVEFMSQHIGDDFSGFITSVTNFGFYVELNDIFIEGLVSVRDLTDDYYIFNNKTLTLSGRKKRKIYKVGEPVRIIVAGVDKARGWVNFALKT